MRIFICLAFLMAFPGMAVAQSPLPAGWHIEADAVVHAVSGLSCRATVGQFKLGKTENGANGDALCTYVQACALPPASCAPAAVFVLGTVPDAVKAVAEARTRMIATPGAKLNSGPGLGATQYVVGDLTPTRRFGLWASPFRGMGVAINGTYDLTVSAASEEFIAQFLAMLPRTAPAPSITRTSAPAASPTTNTLACPLTLGSAKLEDGRPHRDALVSQGVISAGAQSSLPTAFFVTDAVCDYSPAAGRWSTTFSSPGAWSVEVAASRDKDAVLAKVKEENRIFGKPNSAVAKIGVEQLGFIESSNMTEVYLGPTRNGVTMVVRARHLAADAPAVDAAVRAAFSAQP